MERRFGAIRNSESRNGLRRRYGGQAPGSSKSPARPRVIRLQGCQNPHRHPPGSGSRYRLKPRQWAGLRVGRPFHSMKRSVLQADIAFHGAPQEPNPDLDTLPHPLNRKRDRKFKKPILRWSKFAPRQDRLRGRHYVNSERGIRRVSPGNHLNVGPPRALWQVKIWPVVKHPCVADHVENRVASSPRWLPE